MSDGLLLAADFLTCLSCLLASVDCWLTSHLCCFRARVVPENITKKHARDAKLLAHNKAAREAAKKERAAKRATAAANAQKYAAEYAAADKATVDAKRAAKKAGNFFVEGQPKIAFVIRTRG